MIKQQNWLKQIAALRKHEKKAAENQKQADREQREATETMSRAITEMVKLDKEQGERIDAVTKSQQEVAAMVMLVLAAQENKR